ncbi:src substrate cortactin-like [Bufo gargarizans]|uniref:src substrate cortactin-like n=1 Tax=Bufo gargarizans TaxID=30331 RepID=UPI001CF14A6E|nr:src substrate cortactin-like [Bufo gargarizans]
MWKASAGHNVTVADVAGGDDWETDPDFVNDITEEEQRWGAKTIQGSGRPQHVDIKELRSNVSKEHEQLKKKEFEQGPKASYGYGGQFGTERDRMDKTALGHDYRSDVVKHASQTDAAKGFGGKYGVQKERCDKSAVGYDYKGQTEKHSSQQDHSKGFGGRFGVQTDRVDKSALGFEHKEQLQKHSSQQDHSIGFGGKFGVQKDRQDKSAHTWSHKEQVQLHESQTDYAKGFGGRYGVQTDRVDKSASGFGNIDSPSSAYEKTQPLEAMTSGAQNLRSRFENIAKVSEEENRQKAEEERARRQKKDEKEREAQVNKESQCKSDIDQSQKQPVPAPVPIPRISVTPQTPEKEDSEYEAPPVLPPRLPEMRIDTVSTPEETSIQDDTYEDISVPPPDTEDDYEAIPDPPPRLEEEENDEGYEIMDPSVPQEVCLYEELPQEKEKELSKHSGQMGASGITAIALYDYDEGGDDEISFQPQDLITDIEMIDEGWWSGSCRGQRGLFPANYVELIQ